MPYTLAQLNQMDEAAFVRAFGDIFEHSPAIAQQAWQQRPFPTITDLHQTMMAVVKAMSREEKLRLIQAHPDLGSKAKMAEASVKEQAGAGLDRLSPEEYEQFHHLNQAYQQKFGFPFIIAVKNHTKASILHAFQERLNHTESLELEQALEEIRQIAWFRLTDAIVTPEV